MRENGWQKSNGQSLEAAVAFSIRLFCRKCKALQSMRELRWLISRDVVNGFYQRGLQEFVSIDQVQGISPRRRSAGAGRRTNMGGRVSSYLVMHGARPIDRLSQVAGGNSRRDPHLAPGFLKGPAGPLSRAPRLGTRGAFLASFFRRRKKEGHGKAAACPKRRTQTTQRVTK